MTEENVIRAMDYPYISACPHQWFEIRNKVGKNGGTLVQCANCYEVHELTGEKQHTC